MASSKTNLACNQMRLLVKMMIVKGIVQQSGLVKDKSDSGTMMNMMLMESKLWSNGGGDYSVASFERS